MRKLEIVAISRNILLRGESYANNVPLGAACALGLSWRQQRQTASLFAIKTSETKGAVVIQEIGQ